MSEKPKFTASSKVQVTETAAPTAKATNSAECPSPDPKVSTDQHDEGAFFPWLEDGEENQKLSPLILARFPVLGAVGLIGSALTPLLSFLVLHFFNGRQLVTGRMPKPAAWLSIILSINSILVHMAVSQGITVSWWFRAAKKQTTVADLHRVWATGSSVLTAITEWKVFNYIALATVLVATLPANGIILQNSISTKTLDVNLTDSLTSYSIADHLPLGMSATLDPDGSMDLYRYPWQQAMPRVVGNYDGFFKQSEPTDTTCKGYCEANVTGIGFKSQCVTTLLPYDLPLDNQQHNGSITYNVSAPNVNYTIFETGINWDRAAPYMFNLTTVWKDKSSCVGDFQKTFCQLQLGSLEYPVEVAFNGSNDGKYYWALRTNDLPDAGEVDSLKFTPYESNGEVESVPGKDSTYGGIVTALAAYYNSSITLDLDNTANSTKLQVHGFYAEQLNTFVDVDILDYRCNVSLRAFGNGNKTALYSSPADDLLGQIRNTLFYTSIYAMEDNMNDTELSIWVNEAKPQAQIVAHDLDQLKISQYHVIWRWYFSSLALTLGIVLFILPTFYGFWTLARKATLSPFETARAFHAPILHDQPTDLDTPTLLKTVGQKNLHTDLVLSPPTSPFGPLSPQAEKHA